ncbi:MAG TPA: anhydro-N-acetylmuramic acid kinase [Bacteroidia bacterium]|nr:anhydro-N-acetylmuramic acid kinase [Bacteroidia bacterium]
MTDSGNRAIGLMSGTSLDGLDICLVRFADGADHWKYEIEFAETVPYPGEWIEKLIHAEKTSPKGQAGTELMKLHSEYGKYLGECVASFLKKNKTEKPLFVASHGHTIFHQPQIGYTFQLGSGVALTSACGIPVVCDFRTLDVALGGQGAPLVPVGDALLFKQYDYCLNLGGFANISFDQGGKRIAYDICAVNYVLNRLAKRLGKNYDENGDLSASGKIIPEILEKLNALPYYKKSAPKSIGREWVEESIFPLLSENHKTEDLLATFTGHAAEQISKVISANGNLLVTGGGAHNLFFIEQLKKKCTAEIIIPDSKTIDFKEALIFGFLGLLRWNNQINTLASVTGARQDSSGGRIFY